MSDNSRDRLRAQEGFTLIELLVVIAILGILAGVVTFRVVKEIDKARVTKAEQQIQQFRLAVDKYYMDVARYPSNEQGLRALIERPSEENLAKLWDGPYLQTDVIPLDPWQNEYVYRASDDELVPYEIISYGKDGVEGGEGTAADVSTRTLGR
jgi:general secretion pathway protein G